MRNGAIENSDSLPRRKCLKSVAYPAFTLEKSKLILPASETICQSKQIAPTSKHYGWNQGNLLQHGHSPCQVPFSSFTWTMPTRKTLTLPRPSRRNKHFRRALTTWPVSWMGICSTGRAFGSCWPMENIVARTRCRRPSVLSNKRSSTYKTC